MDKKILIVDDSAAAREAVRSQLEGEQGLTVCGEAANGLEAIEKAKELKPDLIILDLAMPRLNGAEAASVLKRTLPKVCIILLTMYAEAADALAPAIGIDAVLAKPEGFHELAQTARKVCRCWTKWPH